MHILMTGGTGLIGSALIKRCLPLDYRFTVLTRQLKTRRLRTQLGSAIEKRVSVDQLHFVQSLKDVNSETRFNAVINLAGEPIANARWSDARKQKLIASRVGTTELLINFMQMRKHKPRVLVSGSAVGWYGDQGVNVVNERSAPHQEFSHELCKLWENTASTAENFDVRVCLLRTGLVLAPNGGFLKRMLPPFKFGLGGRLGYGQQYMPWVHIDDIVSMILFLIENENCSGAFNATAPTPVTNEVFTHVLGKILKRPTLFPVPAWFLKLAFGEMSQLLLGGQNALPEKFTNAGYQFKYRELHVALTDVLKNNAG